MVIDCPHCHSRVLPLVGGRCPACQGDTTQPPKEAADRATILVDEVSKLPEFCCTCTQPTQRKVRLTQSHAQRGETVVSCDEDGGHLARVFSRLLLGGVFTRLFSSLATSGGKSQSGQTTVSVAMRQCRTCSREQPLSPLGVNYDHGTMRLVVHRNFAEAFGVVNEKGG